VDVVVIYWFELDVGGVWTLVIYWLKLAVGDVLTVW
jgi:hypothetical protein